MGTMIAEENGAAEACSVVSYAEDRGFAFRPGASTAAWLTPSEAFPLASVGRMGRHLLGARGVPRRGGGSRWTLAC